MADEFRAGFGVERVDVDGAPGRERRALAIVCVPGSVRRLFDVAGVADLLFLYSSREEVAADLVPTA